jgi:hypothetical protein
MSAKTKRFCERGEVCRKPLPPEQCVREGLPPGSVCGQVHEMCLAHAKVNLKGRYSEGIRPCRGKVVKYFEVCKVHGAKSPRAKERVQRIEWKLARDKAVAEFLHQMNVVAIDDPMASLERAIAESGALYEFYRDRVSLMRAEDQRWQTALGMEQLRSEVSLMERALDRFLKGLEGLAKLKKGDDNKPGESLLDLIKAGLDAR